MSDMIRKILERKENILPVVLLLPLMIAIIIYPQYFMCGDHAVNMLEHMQSVSLRSIPTHYNRLISQWFPLHHGPLQIYLWLPFELAFNDFYALYASLASFTLLTGFIIYHFTKEFFGLHESILAVVLYSTIPFIPYQTRIILEGNWIPALSLLTIYAAFKIRFKKDWRFFPVLCFALPFPLMSHVTTLPLMAILLIIPWKNLVRHSRHFLAGLAIGLLITSPYIIYLVNGARSGAIGDAFNALSTRTKLQSDGDENQALTLEILLNTFFTPEDRLFVQHPWLFLHHGRASNFIRHVLGIYKGIFVIGFALALFFIIRRLVQSLNQNKKDKTITPGLVVLLLTVLVIISLIPFPYYRNHYFHILFILSIILSGIGIVALHSIFKKKILSIILWIFIGIVSTISLFAFILTLKMNASSGVFPTLSGLSIPQERILSTYITEHHPCLRPSHIIIPDGFNRHIFNSHAVLQGRDEAYRFCEEELSQEFLIVLTDAYGISEEMEQIPTSDTQLYLIRTAGAVGGEASISASDPWWSCSTIPSSTEWHDLALPRSEVDNRSFPKLGTGLAHMAYQYQFNSTGNHEFIFFVDGLKKHPLIYCLDGKQLNETQHLNSGAMFTLELEQGQHIFTALYKEKPDTHNSPFTWFDILLFRFAEEEKT